MEFWSLFSIGTVIVRAFQAVQSWIKQRTEAVLTDMVDVLAQTIRESSRHLSAINDRLCDLEAKLEKDGKLSTTEREEVEHLDAERLGEVAKWADASAKSVTAERGAAASELLAIDAAHFHLVEGHVGLTALNKRCPLCSKLMILRKRAYAVGNGANDFFWACPSFFANHDQHEQIESFSLDDLQLDAEKEIEDWHTPKQDLVKITKEFSTDVDHRIAEHRDDKIEKIVCGIHGEPLILKERGPNAKGLLDRYALRCARCNYAINLSTVGQLSRFLATTEARGIL